MGILKLFSGFVGAFVRSWWWKLRGWEILVSSPVLGSRNEDCQCCPFRKDDMCEKCGCLLASKTLLASEKCPLGIWRREKVAKTR